MYGVRSWSRDATVALAAPAHGLFRRLRLRVTRVERVQHTHRIWDDVLSQRWHATSRKASTLAPRLLSSRCPTCGVNGYLRVQFTGGDDLAGHAAMWCDRCRTGIVTCRSRIPEHAPGRDHGTGDTSPDFVLIYACNDLPPSLRWARNSTAILGLLLAATALTGVILWLAGSPAGVFFLTDMLAWVFNAFGVSSAAAVFLRLRLRWARPEHTFPATAPAATPQGRGTPPPGRADIHLSGDAR